MPTRRTFIESGLLVSSLLLEPLERAFARTGPSARPDGQRAAARPHPGGPLGIVDTRATPSEPFAAGLERAGIAVERFAGDVASVWMRRLESHWNSPRTATIGLTSGPTLFCLELFARERGLRLIHRAPLPTRGFDAAAAVRAAADVASRGNGAAALPLLDLAAEPRGTEERWYSWAVVAAPRARARAAQSHPLSSERG